MVDVLALPGGLSSAVHRLELLDGRVVVLRRYVLADWLEREPDIPADEAEILSVLPRLHLGAVTPELVLADVTASRADVPAVVMTEVPGRPDVDPADPFPWADRMAECLAEVHGVDPDLVGELRPWRRWDHADEPIPSWTTQPELWTEAKARVPIELPIATLRLLHRDFHPCNLHWSDGKLVAVVDWLSACLGEPAADLAHCRWNLAVLAGPEVAVEFTLHYREVTGYEADTTPYDLSSLLSLSEDPFPVRAWQSLGRNDLTPEVATARIDAWLAHLLQS